MASLVLNIVNFRLNSLKSIFHLFNTIAIELKDLLFRIVPEYF